MSPATTQREAWGTFTLRIILYERFDWSWPSSGSMCECCWNISWSCTHACRVKHGFGRGLSLKLTSLFTRRSVTEEARAGGLLEENSGYHAWRFLVFLHVIVNQRQWLVILIHEQCLPKKESKEVYLRDLCEGITRETSPDESECRQDECAGKLWILFLRWSGTEATELEFVWISMCRQQTHRHCAETQAVISFDLFC